MSNSTRYDLSFNSMYHRYMRPSEDESDFCTELAEGNVQETLVTNIAIIIQISYVRLL